MHRSAGYAGEEMEYIMEACTCCKCSMDVVHFATECSDPDPIEYTVEIRDWAGKVMYSNEALLGRELENLSARCSNCNVELGGEVWTDLVKKAV